MGVRLCPKCEINFITDDEKYCTICTRELKRKQKAVEMPEMCASCGEHPCEPGEDLCIFCLNERNLQETLDADQDDGDNQTNSEIGIEEIDVTLPQDDIPDTELRVIHEEFGLDDDEEDDLDEDALSERGMHVESFDDLDAE